MALIFLQVETKNNKTINLGKVLNTLFMLEIKDYNTTHATFRYTKPTEDRRSGYDTYVVTESQDKIKTNADKPNFTNTITLPVFLRNDPARDTEDIVFHCDEILLVEPYELNHDYSWLYVNEKGFKVRKYLVNIYYVDIPGLTITGTTSTTTSTSSTSTSTTSTAAPTTSTTTPAPTSTTTTTTTSSEPQ